MSTRSANDAIPGLVVLVMALPFYLNDFAYIRYQNHLAVFLIIDYLTHVLPVALTAWFFRERIFQLASLRMQLPRQSTLVMHATWLSILGVAIEKLNGPLGDFFGMRFYRFPDISDPTLKVFDLTIGLAFVALSEELVFRGAFMGWLEERGVKPLALVLISSLAFGLIHWGRGPGSILTSFLWGVAPAIVGLRIGSIRPTIVAHYVTDVAAFLQ
jgi:uncharacterized protein